MWILLAHAVHAEPPYVRRFDVYRRLLSEASISDPRRLGLFNEHGWHANEVIRVRLGHSAAAAPFTGASAMPLLEEGILKPRPWGDLGGWNFAPAEAAVPDFQARYLGGMDISPPAAYRFNLRTRNGELVAHEGALLMYVPELTNATVQGILDRYWVAGEAFLGDVVTTWVLFGNPDGHAGQLFEGTHWSRRTGDGAFARRPILLDHGPSLIDPRAVCGGNYLPTMTHNRIGFRVEALSASTHEALMTMPIAEATAALTRSGFSELQAGRFATHLTGVRAYLEHVRIGGRLRILPIIEP